MERTVNEQKWSVLLVDDDQEDYFLVRDGLKEAAARTVSLHWASNFSEGMRALREKSFDAVFVDYRLANEDGLHFIRQATQSGFRLPFILLTSDNRYELDVAAMQAGAADFLSKGEARPRQLERALRYAIERHRLQEANREQSHLFQTIFTVNPDGLAIVTADDMRFQVANPAYRQMTPNPEVDPVGRTIDEVWVPNEVFQASKAILYIVDTQETLRVDQHTFTFPDGSRRTFAFHIQPMTWQGRQAVLVVLWEITSLEEARAQAERRAEEAEEGRRILKAIMEYLPESLVIAEGPDVCIRMLSRHSEVISGLSRERVAGLTYDQFASLIEVFNPDGRTPLPQEDFPLVRAAREGEVVINEEMVLRAADGRLVSLSCNAAPIRDSQGAIIGSMAAFRDITDSKRLGNALRISETKFRGIFDANVVPLFLWNTDGRVLDANDAYLQLVGYTRQEMQAGKLRWTDLTPEEYLAVDHLAIEEMSIGNLMAPYEKEYVLRNGRRIPILCGGAMLGDYGDRGWSFAIDLTERKQTETELANANRMLAEVNEVVVRSNQRMSAVLESITDAYIFFDRDWRYKVVNSVAERLAYGSRPAKDLLGKVIWEEFPEALGTQIYHEYHRAMAENQPVHFETYSVVARRWFEVHAYPRKDGLEVYMRDIDDRKRYEERLAYHARLLENVHDAIIATNEDFFITAWNRAAEDLYGWQASEVIGKLLSEVVRSQITPEIFSEAMQSLAERGAYRLEIAQTTRDGRRIVVESSMIALRDPGGRINGYISANRDATERIQAAAEREQLLRQLEQQQARLSAIITNAPVGIIVADPEGRILLANPVGERLVSQPIPYGLDLSALKGLQFLSTEGKVYTARELPLTCSALSGDRFENLEMQVVLPDGQQRSWLVNSAPIIGADGTMEGAVAIYQDITENRRASELIQRNAARIEIQRYLSRAREQERLNIAHDLHDGPLQEMIGMSFQLSEARMLAEENEIGQQLEAMQTQMQTLINDMRSFCNELRPPALTPFGLERAIRSHAETFQNLHQEISLQLDLMHDGQTLPEPVRVALFQVYREALNNILKHSHASEVTVRFQLLNGEALLEVLDNGQGFKMPFHWVEFARQGHLGLVGIQERAEAVGGNVQLITAPGQGTHIYVKVPVEGEPELVPSEQQV